ncbi:MAG: type II toxin-antitoxin system HicA family toxin [Deltaproteobacteria bacterium]|nr:type II toxin-antitoxin system HicA family toxin [Deltaproteobacteria bacterium]
MSGLNNLDPLRVVKAFGRAGWRKVRTTGSHVILAKAGNPGILSIPIHKGKPIKQGLLRSQIRVAGVTVEKFLELYR